MPFLAKFDQWWWPLTVLIQDHLNWILSMKSWLMMVMRFILSFDAIFGLNSIDIDGDGGTPYQFKVLLNWLQRWGWIGTKPKCRDEADGSPYQSKVLPDWTRSAWRQRPHLGTAALGSFRQIHLQRRCVNLFQNSTVTKTRKEDVSALFSELNSYKSQNSHVSTSPTPSSGRAPKCRQILFTFVLNNNIIAHLGFKWLFTFVFNDYIAKLFTFVFNDNIVHLCFQWIEWLYHLIWSRVATWTPCLSGGQKVLGARLSLGMSPCISFATFNHHHLK